MAQQVYCNGHPDRPAVTLIQQLGTPDVCTWCSECLIIWAASVIEAVSELPPEQATEGSDEPNDAKSAGEAESAVPMKQSFDPFETGGEVESLPGLNLLGGGEEENGGLRAHDRGTGAVHRPTSSEAESVDGGAGERTVVRTRGVGSRRADRNVE